MVDKWPWTEFCLVFARLRWSSWFVGASIHVVCFANPSSSGGRMKSQYSGKPLFCAAAFYFLQRMGTFQFFLFLPFFRRAMPLICPLGMSGKERQRVWWSTTTKSGRKSARKEQMRGIARRLGQPRYRMWSICWRDSRRKGKDLGRHGARVIVTAYSPTARQEQLKQQNSTACSERTLHEHKPLLLPSTAEEGGGCHTRAHLVGRIGKAWCASLAARIHNEQSHSNF